MRSNELVKVNIGSGPHGKPDWVNLDWGVLPLLSKVPWLRHFLVNVHLLPKNYNKPWPSRPRLYDCRKKLPFADGTVDFIYSSHFIEHLPRYQVIKLFAECQRVLHPAGVLRICIPDIKSLAEKYVQGDKDFFLSFEDSDNISNQLKDLADLFTQHLYGYNSWSAPTLVKKFQRLFTRGHLWMYDYDSLGNLLRTVGFSTIKRCEPTQGRVPDIEYLDIHKNGSLFVEISK